MFLGSSGHVRVDGPWILLCQTFGSLFSKIEPNNGSSHFLFA